MSKPITPADIIAYQQRPFETGAYGPDKFDCYGLVWHVNKEHFGIELPRFDDADYTLNRLNALIEGQALSDDWHKLSSGEAPTPGDAVVMRRAGESYHVGVLILTEEGPRILHTTPGHGVLCNDANALTRAGFKHLDYYRYAGN